jgi:hypothetical protein
MRRLFPRRFFVHVTIWDAVLACAVNATAIDTLMLHVNIGTLSAFLVVSDDIDSSTGEMDTLALSPLQAASPDGDGSHGPLATVVIATVSCFV